MLFSCLLVFVLAFRAFVGCTTISTSSPSSTSASSSQRHQFPSFRPYTRPQCVLENADPKFTLQVEKMLFALRGDNTLPAEFRQINYPSGSSIWIVADGNCELRLTPRLRQSNTFSLPLPVIERLWALGLQEAIRNIYLECVKYGQVGGAQVWSWLGKEDEPMVDIEIAILRMHRRHGTSCMPKSRSCVIS